MHIALLTDGITPYVTGGMQRHSFHLARHLLKSGVRLTLVHCVPHGARIPDPDEVATALDAPADRLRVVGFHFPKSGKIPGHYIGESYRYSCMIYDALKEEWPTFDFIYAKGFTPWCLLEKKKKGEHMGPVGIKFHGYEMFQKSRGVRSKMEQELLKPPVIFINRNADCVFSYGGKITELILKTGVEAEKIVEIGSGIDDAWVASAPTPTTDKRTFLFVGRNERRKGIPDLLAVQDVFDHPSLEFHWVGALPESKRIDAPNMVYHGEIKDVAELQSIVDRCDVLVTPSHSEGMPNVILEAMARGLAVIATDVGAVPKMVSDRNGRLIAPRDKKMLREALLDMLNLPAEDLHNMKSHSLEKVRRDFLWSEVARQTLEAIKKFTFTS